MSDDKSKKLTTISLVLMIFTSVYGFNNMPRAYYLMGYAAIPWYIFGAIAFFLPYAFMLAEFGAAYRNEKGGIYSWMNGAIGPKYAFVGTFMWYSSNVIWQVSVCSTILVPLSTAIFGKDITSQLSPQVLGLLGIAWIILVTFVASRGFDKIKKLATLGGLAVTSLNAILFLGGLIVLVLNKGKFAQPILNLTSFIVSPNHSYSSTLSILSFLTFAIFAYGGIEVVAGLVDQTTNPKKTFPRGIIISAIVISIGYALGIFMFGIFVNWDEILSKPNVTIANAGYVVMQNLGYELSRVFGASQNLASTIGIWTGRFVGLSMFLTLMGAFFAIIYTPLRQLIEGTPKEIWPKKFTALKNGMPVYAMYWQTAIVIVCIAIVSFGGKSAAAFFDKIVVISNVAITVPYMFLSIAFPFFKLKKNIEKPFVIYKNTTFAVIISVIVTIVIGFANVFSIIEPALAKNNLTDTILSGGGPILFIVIALIIYRRYERTKADKV